MNRFTSVIVCLVLSVTLYGCGGTTTAGSESEEHLEHFLPPHKPASYADLVQRLRERIDQIPADGRLPETQKTELLDVIRWIPEIAANSNLRRNDWEVAAETGVTMERLFHECFGGSVDGVTAAAASLGNHSGTGNGSVRERFQPLISTLDQMSGRALFDAGTVTSAENFTSGTDVSDPEPNAADSLEPVQNAGASDP